MDVTNRNPPHLDQLPELVTVDEACGVLRIGQTLLRTMLRRGDLPGVRIGRLIRIRKSDLERLVRGCAK